MNNLEKLNKLYPFAKKYKLICTRFKDAEPVEHFLKFHGSSPIEKSHEDLSTIWTKADPNRRYTDDVVSIEEVEFTDKEIDDLVLDTAMVCKFLLEKLVADTRKAIDNGEITEFKDFLVVEHRLKAINGDLN